MLMYVFAAKMLTERWWGKLPISVSWVMFLDTLLVFLFAYKMMKGILLALFELVGLTKKEEESSIEDKRAQFAKKQRSKSVFDVTRESGRRSSIFESISDIGALTSSLNSSTRMSSVLNDIKED
jgi:hypothetical protein